MRDSVVFYRSFFEAIQEEEDPVKRAQAYDAIFAYALDEEEPEGLKGVGKAAFILAKPQIDANNKRHNDGCKGGRPPKKTTGYENQKPLVSENAENKKPNENENENENENVNEKIKGASATPTRHKYGEYKNVLLTDEDLEKLKKEFPTDYQQRIEDLSIYMRKSGKSYKDHLATIRSWNRRDIKQKQEKSSNNKGFEARTDYDMAELEKRLLTQGRGG